ncbi:hypothetical protein [Saccharicrinis fermentans]|uniref:Uncharacterized protein n=1 Tax=Saccharicrinis fermentans DSM 9555 = JCM 21142 TaxID=869213 RepID=W7XXM1_9BACT|nr:hypothetical protein [Saccharicrinis fermentans]GAF03195.1 hypothetical protein JCM21142_41860 [Saccharicrinis fermentans DSM 9555 = JCM 21142]
METKTKFWQDVRKDWQFYFDEGKSYLNTCKKLIVNPKSFDNEFIYNLAVLAGERLVLGMLLSYDYIPSSTSLSGMLQEGKEFYQLDEDILEGARFLNKFQTFCSLEVIPFTPPDQQELESIVKYIVLIAQFSTNNLNKLVTAEE